MTKNIVVQLNVDCRMCDLCDSLDPPLSGNKADLVLRTYAVFSRAKEGCSAALSRRMGSSICKYHEIYSLKCGHLP